MKSLEKLSKLKKSIESPLCVYKYRDTIPEEQTCRSPLFERGERDGSLDRANGRNDNSGSHRALARARRAQNKRSISLGAEAALLSSSTTESEEDDDGYEEGKIS